MSENSIMIYGLPTALKCNMLERNKYKVEVMKGAAGGGI